MVTQGIYDTEQQRYIHLFVHSKKQQVMDSLLLFKHVLKKCDDSYLFDHLFIRFTYQAMCPLKDKY